MKKITLNLLKGLLVIVLFTGVSVVLSTTGVQTVSEVNAKVIGAPYQGAIQQAQRLTAAKVNQYLIDNGYDVYGVTSIKGTSKFKAIVAGVDGPLTIIVDAGIINNNSNGVLAGQETSL